jgi:zinc protease
MHLSFRDRRGAEIAANVPFGTADVLHRMLELGSASRTRDELRGRIAELGLVLKVTDSDFVPYDDYYFSAEHSYVRVESVDNACEEALLLLAELLSSPRFEETAFSTALAAAIARSEKDRDSPAERAELAYYSALGDAHPLAEGPLGDPEKLRALTLEHVKRFHSRYFRPERAVIAISASVDPGRIRSALETTPLFASAPTSLETSEASAWRGRPIEGRVETIVELGREQSYLIVGAPLEPIAETEEAALRLAVAVLSERLSERLREEEGLAYSIGASVRFASPGPNVRMSAGTRSGNLERLEEGMRAVVKSLIESPPGEEEIAGARNRAEGQRRMRRLARIGQAYALATEELHGRDPRELDSDLPGLRAVGPAEVLRASERYLGFESSIVAIAK